MEHDIKVGDKFLGRYGSPVKVCDVGNNLVYYTYGGDNCSDVLFNRPIKDFLVSFTKEFKKQDKKELTMKYKVGHMLKRITDGDIITKKGKSYLVTSVNSNGAICLYGLNSVYTESYINQNFEIDFKNSFSITIATTTNDMTLFKDLDGIAKISCGCFLGTLSEAMDLAKSKQRDDYISAVTLLTEIANSKGMLSEPVKTYNIELTEDECKVLAVVCQHIGGCPHESSRKHTDSINIKLKDMGFNGYGDSIVDNTRGSIHFKGGNK